jgi:anthranilate phosphoribosyltransferase
MFKDVLDQLLNHQDLSTAEMLKTMQQVMGGELTPVQISAFLIALRCKGETVDEVVAAATVMRELSNKVTIEDTVNLVDTCGTGGDGIQTFNVSTISAFVAAAAGAKVAKHGGRSVSSACGSADVLEVLGVNVNQTPEQVSKSVNEIGIGFMFAPNHHSAMKYAAPVRRELGIRTLFNLLGPLTNPANAKRQVMGVFDKGLTGKLAKVLQKMGSEHVLVVHGADGMDEISFTGDTFVAELKDGKISEYTLNPKQFGLSTHQLKDIQIQNAQESKVMILDVLAGKLGAARDIVLLNAGAAIYVAGLKSNIHEGVEYAAKIIDSGEATSKLQQLIRKSHQV